MKMGIFRGVFITSVNFMYTVFGFVMICAVTSATGRIEVLDTNGTTVYSLPDFQLSVAPFVPEDGLTGRTYYIDSKYSCNSSLFPPAPNDTISLLKSFALMFALDRCPYSRQIKYAQKAGYDLAILYGSNYLSLQSYAQRQASDNEIMIPAVSISNENAHIIIRHYLYNTSHYLVVYPERTFDLSVFLVPFVIVVGVCFLIMLLFMIVKCIRDYRTSRRNRLSPRHLNQLETIKYKKGDQYDVCAICLEEYNEGEKLRILPCSHAYHTKCIDPWLTNSHRTCPVCKRKVILAGFTSDSDSESDGESENTPLLANAGPPTNRNNNRLIQSLSTIFSPWHTPSPEENENSPESDNESLNQEPPSRGNARNCYGSITDSQEELNPVQVLTNSSFFVPANLSVNGEGELEEPGQISPYVTAINDSVSVQGHRPSGSGSSGSLRRDLVI